MLRVTPAWRNVSARYGKPPTFGRIAIALWNAASRFSIALLIRSPFAREPLPPSAFHESAHPVTTTRPRRTGCSVNSRPTPQDRPTLCPLFSFRLQLANSSPHHRILEIWDHTTQVCSPLGGTEECVERLNLAGLPLLPATPSSRCESPAPVPSDSRRRTRAPPFRKRLRLESGPMPLDRYPLADRSVPWPARSGGAGVPPRLSDAHSEPGEPAPLRRRRQSRH